MNPQNLLVICSSAFIAVFFLLSFLAVVMRLLMVVYPKTEDGLEPAIVAALTAAATYAFPGTRITKVEETR